jgi:hypothetical protein
MDRHNAHQEHSDKIPEEKYSQYLLILSKSLVRPNLRRLALMDFAY